MKDADVANEKRAIDKLYAQGSPANLVSVIAHGWLANSPYYFIDMELCAANLEIYIRGDFSFQLSDTDWPANRSLHDDTIQYTWDIVEQITAGLQFIHSLDEVHRDLKPRNDW